MLHCVAGNLTYTDVSNIRGAFVIKYWQPKKAKKNVF
jgi:hypothetical protein